MRRAMILFVCAGFAAAANAQALDNKNGQSGDRISSAPSPDYVVDNTSETFSNGVPIDFAPSDPFAAPNQNQVISDGGGVFDGILINNFVGADRFYNAGYTGGNAIVAITEGGNAWNGHDATMHVQNYNAAGTVGQVVQHSTWVTTAAAGSGSPVPTTTEAGIAFGAETWTWSILSQFLPDPLNDNSFQSSPIGQFNTYNEALRTGSQTNGRTADVFNSSWGSTTSFGPGNIRDVLVDAFIHETGAVGVVSAGNSGSGGPGVLGTPGNALNAINVGATTDGNAAPFYDSRAGFSAFGATRFWDRTTRDALGDPVFIENAYIAVDIVAPGTDWVLPFVPDDFEFPNAATNFYNNNISGTSFSAPTVAGGAALLVDAARGEFNAPLAEIATNAMVIKAVLMNSADKSFVDYDNGQFLDTDGAIRTFQAKDAQYGAGQLDLNRAFDQFLSGTTDLAGTDGGEVEAIGWDMGNVAVGAEQFYTVDTQLAGGTDLTVTLSWLAEYNLGFTPGAESVSSDRFADLDLRIYELDAQGNILSLLAESASAFQSSELLNITLAQDTFIGFGVFGFGEVWDFDANGTDTDFALAWAGTAVPTPLGAGVFGAAGLFAARRRRG
ncbi:MAG: S8 family serine peptidase [Planctomycetota bacterium]